MPRQRLTLNTNGLGFTGSSEVLGGGETGGLAALAVTQAQGRDVGSPPGTSGEARIKLQLDGAI